jgi:hypothetical protein
LVLSCLGQAADVLASATRSSATGSTSKAPLKLEQVVTGYYVVSCHWCHSGEVPDRSARCLKKGGGSPAMFHRPALLKSTCTKRAEVSQTPTLILERRKGSRNSEAKATQARTVRAPRRSHTVRPVLQSMGKLLAAPSAGVGGWECK